MAVGGTAGQKKSSKQLNAAVAPPVTMIPAGDIKFAGAGLNQDTKKRHRLLKQQSKANNNSHLESLSGASGSRDIGPEGLLGANAKQHPLNNDEQRSSENSYNEVGGALV